MTVFLLRSWLFEGLGRDKAEELLQLPDTKMGSFMIRESETKKGEQSGLLFLCLGQASRFVPNSLQAVIIFLFFHNAFKST